MTLPASDIVPTRQMHPPPPPPPPPPPQPSRMTESIRHFGFLLTPSFDDVEDVREYRPGGYHPVALGDVIHGRYRVLRKLGHGGFATVWLARDLHADVNIALKILKGDCTKDESGILEHLGEYAPDLRITHLRGRFIIRGVNGYHRCLVLDLGGPSLKQARISCLSREATSLSFRKTTARRLIDTLANLYAHGICHGDLTDKNVLFEVEGMQHWTEEELNYHLGPPRTEPLLQRNRTPAPGFCPPHVVESLNYSQLDIALLCSKLLLTDFGEAFFTQELPEQLGTPTSFAAPELFFGRPLSPAAELWSLGCLLYEVHTLSPLIPLIWGRPSEAIDIATDILGAIPQEWRDSYDQPDIDRADREQKWFDDSAQRHYPLRARVQTLMPRLSLDQLTSFVGVLKTVLVFQPSARKSPREVSTHPWFAEEEFESYPA